MTLEGKTASGKGRVEKSSIKFVHLLQSPSSIKETGGGESGSKSGGRDFIGRRFLNTRANIMGRRTKENESTRGVTDAGDPLQGYGEESGGLPEIPHQKARRSIVKRREKKRYGKPGMGNAGHPVGAGCGKN